ncbi:MAG: outer membrane protein assembly factor BamB [Rudaea sp.]
MKRIATLLMLAIAVTGCAAIKNIFNDVKKENIEPPTPLTEIAPSVQFQKLWQERVGKGADRSGVRMSPAFADGKLFVSGVDGTIASLDAATGKTLWSKRLGSRHGFILHHGSNSVQFSGGPGSDGTIVVVGSLEGVAQAFDAASGEERWSSQLSSEVIAAPVIADGIVVIRTNDGRLYGLDAKDGTRKWTYDRSTVPVLTLRGNATPRVDGGFVFAGADNGKLVAITLAEGKTAWEQTVSNGEGRTEIERLQDVDGNVVVADGVVYASGYHGQVVALTAQTGRPLWTHPLSSYTGVGLAPTQLFVADTDSVVSSLDLRTGASNWKQEGLKYRWLSNPTAIGDYLVVGDLDGFVHVLSGSDGKIAARDRLSKHAIQGVPVVVGDTVYIEDVDGAVGAWRLGK